MYSGARTPGRACVRAPGPSAVVLTGVQAAPGALQPAVSERRVLFGFESERGQAGVASVPVNAVRGAGRPVRASRGRHGRVDPGRADPVQVADVVETRGGHSRHGGGTHPGSHGHGGDGVRRRKHGLRCERAHGVEECEVLGGQRGRGQAFVGPVVVGVGRVHVVVRLHETAELGQVAVFAQVHLLVPLPLPPLGPTVFKPHLEETGRSKAAQIRPSLYIFLPIDALYQTPPLSLLFFSKLKSV